MQDERRADNGDDRRGIDVRAGLDRPEQEHRAVPGHKAGRGGEQAEEEQVRDVQRLGPGRERRREALEQGGHQQEQQPVAENAAGQRHGAVAYRTQLAHDHRIHAPNERRAHAEQHAARVEVQLAHPCQRGHRHARHRAHKAEEEPAAELFAQHDRRDQRGEQRRRRHDHAHKRGGNIGQRDVFHQKVQRHAGQAREREQRLVRLFLRLHQPFPGDQQRQKAEREPRDHDLERRKRAQQHLGRDKGRAPDQFGEHCQRMPLQGMVCFHSLHPVCPLRRAFFYIR